MPLARRGIAGTDRNALCRLAVIIIISVNNVVILKIG